ncbi:iron-containing alcohol dehydrogenase [Treponema pectinovorum]|uniref:iron-containing alcohol dehydrogenase n=1 Tax=Treponema pectinovorum TaxID=164 RepID=UPI003D927F7D
MLNFYYYAPTKVVFGKNTEEKAGELVKDFGGSKVLVHFGGNSAKKSGLLNRVINSLKEAGLTVFELGGVVPNPHLKKVQEGIDLVKKEKIDFILAVGGGSVIDSAKGIAMGALTEKPVWDFYLGKEKPGKCLPVGAILTISAAGSEMSCSSVITNEDGFIKRGLNNDYYRPKFAILNPELTMSLPAYQTFAGCADILMHTMERYFARDKDHSMMVDSIAIGLLKTVIYYSKILVKRPNDYTARAEIMWAGSLSHNTLTGPFGNGDWATHQLEHELSGMFDVTHGAGLAALWATWARYVYKEDLDRFVTFATDVFGIPAPKTQSDKDDVANAGIDAMEQVFRDINMPVSIRQLNLPEWNEQIIEKLAEKASFGNSRTLGAIKKLDKSDMKEIYRLAY